MVSKVSCYNYPMNIKREADKKWRTENVEKVREIHRRHYLKRKEKAIETSKKTYHNDRDKIFEILGMICIRCGFNDRRALQIDHIEGGGNMERKYLTSRGSNYLKFVLEDITENKDKNYQILCANCNWIKRSENKEIGNRYGSYAPSLQEVVDSFHTS